MRLAFYQPEIPQNTGTIIRLAACMGIPLDIIEPCGFVWNDKKLERAGMDYIDLANVRRHPSYQSFKDACQGRIVLIDTKGITPYYDFSFQSNDVLMLGQESTGVPQEIFDSIHDRVVIPMQQGRRSLNVAIAGAMVLSEALRQLRKE